MDLLLAAGLAAMAYRFTAASNAFVAALVLAIGFLLVLLFGYYVRLDFRARQRAALQRKVTEAVARELQAKPEAPKVVIAGKDELFTRRGLAVLSEVFAELNSEGREALRTVLLRMGFGNFLAKQMKSDNEDYLVEIVRLVGEMDLVGLDARITALLYAHRSNVDLQYQSFLALSQLGSFEPLVRVCMDESYVHILSFRSLQKILTSFNGDRQKLYETLLAAPDHYVVRICLKGIGTEHMEQLAPKVLDWLGSDDYNLVIDAVRTLGQLRYVPAADTIARLLGHPRWEVRSIAATSLAAIDRDRYEDVLIKALQDSEWQVRYNAGAALRSSPRMEAIRAKVQASGDKYALDMLDYMAQSEKIWRRAE